jgi:hypothetical protein
MNVLGPLAATVIVSGLLWSAFALIAPVLGIR